MWKEKLANSKFPFVANTEEEAEKILFKDSPERVVLLKWIYNLLYGPSDDISVNELAEYFQDIVEVDPLKFVKGDCLKKHQRKVWNNLFKFAGLMKCTPEMCKSFADKHHEEMSNTYPTLEENQSESRLMQKAEYVSPEIDMPDWDTIITDLRERIKTPASVSISEENKKVPDRWKEYCGKLEPILLHLKTPDPVEIEKQKEFGKSVATLCTTLQFVETVMKSSSSLVTKLRHLEGNLHEHKSKNNLILEQVKELEGGLKL